MSTSSSSPTTKNNGPDPIDIAVGNRIRMQRKQLGVTQAKLAEHLGITFQQVQKYERAANRVSASMLVLIAERLETTVAALVGETNAPESDPRTAQLLATPGVYELLEAFANVKRPKRRATLIALIREMGEDEAHPHLRAVS